MQKINTFLFWKHDLRLLYSIPSLDSDKDYTPLVACFVAVWSVWRENAGHFSVDSLDSQLCNHISAYYSLLDKQEYTIKEENPLNSK